MTHTPPRDSSDSSFRQTVAAFEQINAEHPHVGSQLTIRSASGVLVSVAGGDDGMGSEWTPRTVVSVWSVAKGLAATVLAGLATSLPFSLSDPLGRWWPEVETAAHLSIADVLRHRAGLVGLRRPVTARDLTDWPRLAREFETTDPWWTPGADFGYHSWTLGLVLNSLAHRVGGASLDAILGSPHVGGQGMVRFGRPPEARVARQIRLDVSPSAAAVWLGESEAPETAAALRNPSLSETDVNADWWPELDLPSAKAYANAEGIAAVAARLLPGADVAVPKDEIETMFTGGGRGQDRVLADDREFGAGLVLGHPDSACPYSHGARMRYGFDGMGGSFFCVDAEAGLVLAWVTNGLGRSINRDPRKLALLEAFDDDAR